MGKKVAFAIIFVLFIVVLVFTGLYFFYDTDTNKIAIPTAATTSESLTEEDEYMDEDMSDEDSLPGDTFEEDLSAESKDDYVPSDEYLSDNAEDVIYSTFVVTKVVDHSTGETVQPRVVFGSGYNEGESYIKFDSKNNFEMYFSGYFNKVKTGTFAEHDDIIYVVYDNGSAAEYDIRYNDDGIITYIKVNYGDYDVYFS